MVGFENNVTLDRAFDEAVEGMTARPNIGLLLPCNVTVEAPSGGALVDAGQVTAMHDLGDVHEIADLAADVDAGARLDRVATALRGG